MEKTNNTTQWSTIIQSKTGWFDISMSEVWKYRDLVMLFVRRDFVSVYKQTILGPLWFLIQPLFSTLVFTIIFGKVAKIPTDGVPHALFYLSGIVCWNYFSSCLVKTSDTFVSNAGLFGKVYFPRLTVSIGVVITNMISFLIQFLLFMGVLFYYYLAGAAIQPNLWVLAIPLLLLEMAALGLGTGILISSLTTKYRDLAYLATFGVQLWMYGTPIVYPLSQIPQQWQWLYYLNPVASIVESFRFAFLGVGGVTMSHILSSIGIIILILVIGVIVFSRIEKNFMDTV